MPLSETTLPCFRGACRQSGESVLWTLSRDVLRRDCLRLWLPRANLPFESLLGSGSSPMHSGLVGNWKLISSHMSVNNQQPTDYPGPNPSGYLVLTSEGRMMAFMVSGDRKFGSSDVDAAQLFRS